MSNYFTFFHSKWIVMIFVWNAMFETLEIGQIWLNWAKIDLCGAKSLFSQNYLTTFLSVAANGFSWCHEPPVQTLFCWNYLKFVKWVILFNTVKSRKQAHEPIHDFMLQNLKIFLPKRLFYWRMRLYRYIGAPQHCTRPHNISVVSPVAFMVKKPLSIEICNYVKII